MRWRRNWWHEDTSLTPNSADLDGFLASAARLNLFKNWCRSPHRFLSPPRLRRGQRGSLAAMRHVFQANRLRRFLRSDILAL